MCYPDVNEVKGSSDRDWDWVIAKTHTSKNNRENNNIRPTK